MRSPAVGGVTATGAFARRALTHGRINAPSAPFGPPSNGRTDLVAVTLSSTVIDSTGSWISDAAAVPRQAAFALFSNAVRSRAFWGTPLPSSTIQVV